MATKGKVQIEIKAEDKASAKMVKIGKSADAMSGKFRTMGKVMVGVGIALATVLGAAIVTYAKMGDEVAKMAKRTGLSVEMLSELRHVAELTGTELTSIEKATKRMSKTIVDADEGMATYIRAFERIGIEVKDLKDLSPEDQFWTIARAIGNLENATLRAATAQDIFGRAGTQLLPMMAEGAEALDLMRQEAHDLGIVFDEEAAAKAEMFTDANLNLKESLQGIGIALAETLIPKVTEFIENITEVVIKIQEWAKANPDLAKTILIVASALVGVGGFIWALSSINKAVFALNMALAIMHGLMGPAGWAKLAAGLAIAAAAIWGINKLMGTEAPGVTPGELQQSLNIPAPLQGSSQIGAGQTTVNINVGNYMGDESSLRSFSQKMKEIMAQDGRRTSFPGINRAGYFPGSSSL